MPSDQQDDELKVADVCVKGSQVYTKYTLKKIKYFIFLKLFILDATCYNLKIRQSICKFFLGCLPILILLDSFTIVLIDFY